MGQIFLQNLSCWLFSFLSTYNMLAALQIRPFNGQLLSVIGLWPPIFIIVINVIGGFSKKSFYYYFQKQPYAYILHNRCCKKFCNIHRKTSVLVSLFNKVAGLTVCNFISTLFQKRLQHRWLQQSENCEIFTNSFFYGTPPVAAFVSLIK